MTHLRSDLDTNHRHHDVLGVRVTATTLSAARQQIADWIAVGRRTYVCVTGVHGVMESQKDTLLRRIHNAAGMVVPDGMPLVYLSRLSGHTHTTRVYGPDLMEAVCRDSLVSGRRHFFYGTTQAILDQLCDRLRDRFPGIVIAGSYSPPFRELTDDERREIALRINRCAPDIVWVGLSTPKQERWMADFRDRLAAPVLIGVGAAFAFHAGVLRQAPRWLQPLCLEWAFRLLVEPRRLWRRYLVNNPQFIFLTFLQLARIRRYDSA